MSYRKCYGCGWSIGRVRTAELCRVRILLMASMSESVMKDQRECLAIQRMEYVEASVAEAKKRAEERFDKGLA